MRKLAIASAGVLIALVFSCGDSTTGPGPSPADEWIPLTVGNWWTSSYDGFMVIGTVADTFDVSGSMERNVTALLQHHEGFQVYEVRSLTELILTNSDTSIVYPDTQFIYLRKTNDELRGYQDTVSTYHELIAKYPLTLGESWLAYSDETKVYEVTSLNSSVTVPAGTFSGCAVITQTDPDEPYFQYDSYQHMETGVVFDYIVLGGFQDITVSLESYYVQ